MAIPEQLKGRYVYHFTLIDNLASILKHGLLSANAKQQRNIAAKTAVDAGIHWIKPQSVLACAPNKVIQDFVPFYFAKRTALQFAIINRKLIDQHDLIYFALPLEKVAQFDGVLFSDAAINVPTIPNVYHHFESEKLTHLNWNIIDSPQFRYADEQLKYQQMAEVLVPERLAIDAIDYLVVWDERVKERVHQLFAAHHIETPKIYLDDEHYYKQYHHQSLRSMIAGPDELLQHYQETLSRLYSAPQKAPRFAAIDLALKAIKEQFTTIPELADIDGLKTAYGHFPTDVGTHIRKVVTNLSEVNEYAQLNTMDQKIVTLAAYFHDIGKGPKSRWEGQILPYPDHDHPTKSLSMLLRILTEEIGGLDNESIRKIVMLVAYHDIVGDVVAKGRNEQEILKVIQDENDLMLLIALGKADIMAVNPVWIEQCHQDIEQLKLRIIPFLTTSNRK